MAEEIYEEIFHQMTKYERDIVRVAGDCLNIWRIDELRSALLANNVQVLGGPAFANFLRKRTHIFNLESGKVWTKFSSIDCLPSSNITKVIIPAQRAAQGVKREIPSLIPDTQGMKKVMPPSIPDTQRFAYDIPPLIPDIYEEIFHRMTTYERDIVRVAGDSLNVWKIDELRNALQANKIPVLGGSALANFLRKRTHIFNLENDRVWTKFSSIDGLPSSNVTNVIIPAPSESRNARKKRKRQDRKNDNGVENKPSESKENSDGKDLHPNDKIQQMQANVAKECAVDLIPINELATKYKLRPATIKKYVVKFGYELPKELTEIPIAKDLHPNDETQQMQANIAKECAVDLVPIHELATKYQMKPGTIKKYVIKFGYELPSHLGITETNKDNKWTFRALKNQSRSLVTKNITFKEFKVFSVQVMKIVYAPALKQYMENSDNPPIPEQSDYDNVNALEENLKKLNYSENMEISADEFEQIISSLKKIQPFDRYFSSDMSVRQEFPIEDPVVEETLRGDEFLDVMENWYQKLKTVLHSGEFSYLWDRKHGYLQKSISLPFRPKSPVKDLEDTDEMFCKKFKDFKNSMFHFSRQYHKLKRERENRSGQIDVGNLTELGLTEDQLPKGRIFPHIPWINSCLDCVEKFSTTQNPSEEHQWKFELIKEILTFKTKKVYEDVMKAFPNCPPTPKIKNANNSDEGKKQFNEFVSEYERLYKLLNETPELVNLDEYYKKPEAENLAVETITEDDTETDSEFKREHSNDNENEESEKKKLKIDNNAIEPGPENGNEPMILSGDDPFKKEIKSENQETKKIFTCPMCKATCPTAEALGNHVLSHTE